MKLELTEGDSQEVSAHTTLYNPQIPLTKSSYYPFNLSITYSFSDQNTIFTIEMNALDEEPSTSQKVPGVQKHENIDDDLGTFNSHFRKGKGY